MTLKEMNPNEEPAASERQLYILFTADTSLRWVVCHNENFFIYHLSRIPVVAAEEPTIRPMLVSPLSLTLPMMCTRQAGLPFLSARLPDF